MLFLPFGVKFKRCVLKPTWVFILIISFYVLVDISDKKIVILIFLLFWWGKCLFLKQKEWTSISSEHCCNNRLFCFTIQYFASSHWILFCISRQLHPNDIQHHWTPPPVSILASIHIMCPTSIHSWISSFYRYKSIPSIHQTLNLTFIHLSILHPGIQSSV